MRTFCDLKQPPTALSVVNTVAIDVRENARSAVVSRLVSCRAALEQSAGLSSTQLWQCSCHAKVTHSLLHNRSRGGVLCLPCFHHSDDAMCSRVM